MSRRFVLVILITMTMFTAAYAGGKTKIVVIGVDGATWKVITPLLEKGEMPNLKKLMGRGVYGTIETLHGEWSPVIWTSVATGKVPEKHGITSLLFSNDPQREIMTLGRSDMRKVKALWNMVGEQEKRIGVHDWWATYPAERVNGYIVTDLYQLRSSDVWADAALVYPPDLRLLPVPADNFDRGMGTFGGYYADYRYGLFKDIAGSIFLQKEYDADLLMVYTRLLDAVQHKFWRFMRPGECFSDDSFRLDERQLALFADAIPGLYRDVDRWIGDLVKNAGGDSIVIVLSDHGFRGIRKPRIYLHVKKILETFGLGAGSKIFESEPRTFYIANKGREKEIRELFSSIKAEDGTPLYTVSDSDRDGFTIKIRQQVWELSSTHISIRSELFRLDEQDFCFSECYENSGDHDYGDGIFVMAGKHIRKAGKIAGVSVLDITPTVLYLLGLPVGRDMDGTVAVEAIEKSRLDAQPVSFIESYENKERQVGNPARKTNAAEEELKQRLRSLGYIQ